MSVIRPKARLVRQFDLRTWNLRETLRVNPRTKYAETRAGLSWTGIRDYETPNGVLRVLRRRTQVEAPAHLKTLRRLPTPPGHPSGDRDVNPANTSELLAGMTGDNIAIETVDGYARPVSDLTVVRPSVFASMMTADQWSKYASEYPKQSAGVQRAPGPPKTGTSLGYSALWCTPFVEAEITEDNEGALVGSWLGPDGQQHEYDTEHVVDADCELVQRLVRDEGFDAGELGGQHFAIALAAMNGRGGTQSELMRVVDSRQIVDPTLGRVQSQVPRATDNAKHEPAQAQESPDATQEKTSTMATQKVVISVRDAGVADFLKSKGLALAPTSLTLDEMPAEQLEAALSDIMARLASVVEMLKTSEDEGEEMKAKVGEQGEELEKMQAAAADAPDAEGLKKQIAEFEGKLAAAKEELAKAAKTSDEAKTASDAVIADLNEKLAPFHAQQLAGTRDEFVALGLDEKLAADCDSAKALKRAFVLARVGDKCEGYNDEQIESCFVGFTASAPAKTSDDAGKGPDYKPGKGLQVVPSPTIQKPAKTADSEDKPSPQSDTASLIAAACD